MSPSRRKAAAVREPVLVLLDEMTNAEWPADMPADVADRHDAHLAEIYADRHEHDTAGFRIQGR